MPYAGNKWNILRQVIKDQLEIANTVEMINPDTEEHYTVALGFDATSDIPKALKWVLKKMKDIETEDNES